MEQIDDDGWDTGLLSELVTFLSDPNVAIHKGYYSFTRVNTIENLVINTKGWVVQVQ